MGTWGFIILFSTLVLELSIIIYFLNSFVHANEHPLSAHHMPGIVDKGDIRNNHPPLYELITLLNSKLFAILSPLGVKHLMALMSGRQCDIPKGTNS